MSHSNSQPETQALLLASIRTAVLRAQIDASELKTVGIALNAGWISPEYAIEWLHAIGLVDQVIAEQVRS